MFVDQMLTMKTFSLQSAALTLACMFVVCAIFIQTPLGVGVAVLSIGSISFGVVGYLYFWGLDLDPASLCAILMSVGMSVDFTAHTIYSYLNREKEIYQNGEKIIIRMETESERVSNCIHQVMYPMTLGGISTVLCVLPLMIFSDYVPLVFFKTVILVVIFGFYHGVVVLPVVLVLLTPPVERLSKAMKKRFFKRQNIAFIAEDSLQEQQKRRSIEMDSI
jgi:multidrug efflux pump subunit AcrB